MSIVAVVVPVFNAEKWLDETLTSVAAQTWRHTRVIAVDDGSTDGSLGVLQRWQQHSSLRLDIIDGSHKGVSATRNRGLSVVDEPFVALLDADDVWHPEKLELQLASLETGSKAAAAGCAFALWRPGTSGPSRVISFDWSRRAVRRWATFSGFGPLMPSTMLFRTQVVRELGGFREDLAIVEDLDFGMRLRATYPVETSPRCLVRYRQHPGQSHRDFPTLSENFRVLAATSEALDAYNLTEREMIASLDAYAGLKSLAEGMPVQALRHFSGAASAAPAVPAQVIASGLGRIWHRRFPGRNSLVG